MDWAHAIDGLVAELKRCNLKAATVEQYRSFIQNFVEQMKAQGVSDVRQVQQQHIEAHQAELVKRKLKARTVASHTQALRRLFVYLSSTGQLLLDPTEQVVALKCQKSLPRRLITETEMKKLIAAANVSQRTGIRDRAMLEVLYGTGMRIGELCSLEICDADVDLGLVRIRKGKGHKERMLPLGKAAKLWVQEYQTRVRPWWMKGKDHERRLFVTQHGRPLTSNCVNARLRVLCEAANVKAIYPHAIRHAAATHMLRNGADLRMVQKLLGHRHLSTTQRYTYVAQVEVQQTHSKTHPLEQMVEQPA